jgi:hypothetical protein
MDTVAMTAVRRRSTTSIGKKYFQLAVFLQDTLTGTLIAEHH